MVYLLSGLNRYRKLIKIKNEDDSLNVTFIYTTGMWNDEELIDSAMRYVAPRGLIMSSPLIVVFTP